MLAPILVIGLTTAPVAGWCWFSDPRAITMPDGSLVIGALSTEGHPTANGSRLYPAAVFEQDDHDNPAFLRLSDGRLLAAFTTHVGHPYLNISTNPDDASVWDGPRNLLTAFGGTPRYTYAQLAQVGGIIHCFTRWHDAQDVAWTMMSASSDGGLTWTLAQRIVPITYAKVAVSGGRIHLALSGHPRYETTVLRHVYLEAGAWHRSDGSLIASLPFAATDATPVHAGGQPWVWDTTGDAIAFQTFGAFPADHRIRVARWDGSAWSSSEIAATGNGISAAAPEYAGGVAIDRADPAVVYVSRKVGARHEMWRYWPGGSEPITSGSTVDNIRPFSLNGGGVLWLRGTYTDYFGHYWLGVSGYGTPAAAVTPDPSPCVCGAPDLLIADTHATPLTFADILVTEAEDALLYSD